MVQNVYSFIAEEELKKMYTDHELRQKHREDEKNRIYAKRGGNPNQSQALSVNKSVQKSSEFVLPKFRNVKSKVDHAQKGYQLA